MDEDSMATQKILSEQDISFVDSHLHLDLLWQEARPSVDRLARVGCLPVSWAFARDIRSFSGLKQYLKTKSSLIKEIRKNCLSCFYLVGVHPRNIPPELETRDVRGLILPYLDDPLCLGIGETGLETGSNREEEIFRAQLGMAQEAAQRRKVIGIHTPGKDKEKITAQILSILEDFAQWKDSVVVDHCTPGTIGGVLASGLWAGVTVSPPKSTLGEVKKIVERHVPLSGRIMLNTDSGNPLYEDLYQIVTSEDLSGSLKKALTRDNACRFFGIELRP
jgi:predicted metal-dependent TIM-barrel fold hydrolase